MTPIKGQFPERPPTLAEALYQGKEIGNKPENADEILNKLGISSSDSNNNNNNNNKSKEIVNTDKKITRQPVIQKNSFIDSPIPQETETKIDAKYILPEQCEGVINLQMDYIFIRKSKMINYILRSRVFTSLLFGIISMISYYQIGDYFTDYTFSKGYWEGIKKLFMNSYFTDDLFKLVFLILIIIASSFTLLRYITSFLQEEGKSVPNNLNNYFPVDLKEYAALTNVEKNFNKLNKNDKEIVKNIKDLTYSIVYRDTSVAFLSLKRDGKNIEIIGYGVRRVYIKAELLKDLLSMFFKDHVINEKKVGEIEKITVKVYNFEKEDINLFKRAGFYKIKGENIGFITSTILGVTLDTYEFDIDSIEF